MVFHSAVKDREKFQEYAKAVPPTLKPFGGVLMAKGKTLKVLAGHHKYPNIGILKFPDREKAREWYESEAYQKLIPTRELAADMSVVSYEEPPN